MARMALSGDIKRPLITLHGTLDPYLPIANDSDQYARLVRAAGVLYRYYRIQDGSHLDGLHDLFPQVRPLLPCYWRAFTLMTRWVERHQPPPAGKLVRDPHHGDVANTCQGLMRAPPCRIRQAGRQSHLAPTTPRQLVPQAGVKEHAYEAEGTVAKARTAAKVDTPPRSSKSR